MKAEMMLRHAPCLLQSQQLRPHLRRNERSEKSRKPMEEPLLPAASLLPAP